MPHTFVVSVCGVGIAWWLSLSLPCLGLAVSPLGVFGSPLLSSTQTMERIVHMSTWIVAVIIGLLLARKRETRPTLKQPLAAISRDNPGAKRPLDACKGKALVFGAQAQARSPWSQEKVGGGRHLHFSCT